MFSFVFFQALEDDFAYQLEEQERHYGPYLNSALSAEAAAAEVRKYYYCYYNKLLIFLSVRFWGKSIFAYLNDLHFWFRSKLDWHEN